SLVGLADEQRAWLCGFNCLIVATGARDLVFGFEGSDQPGVMGAVAFQNLTKKYDSFDGRRMVVLGSGPLALSTAESALARGVEVPAVVEVRFAAQGERSRVQSLQDHGVRFLSDHVIRSARRGPFGVSGATVVSTRDRNASISLDCDTICLA